MNALKPDEKKLIDDVKSFGWHLVHVPEEENMPTFCYTVGLYETYQSSEILLIGLPFEVAFDIIETIVGDIDDGLCYEPDGYYSEIIEGHDCYMLSVAQEYYKDYVGYALWYYKDKKFPLLQCVYPSLDGAFPWEWDKKEQIFQPVLGSPTAK